MPTKTKTKAPASPSFMNPALTPWVLVSEIYWMSYKVLERRLYHLGVSASQARVLAVLHYSPEPIMPSLVATLLFQETQSITGILHRIESRGWVPSCRLRTGASMRRPPRRGFLRNAKTKLGR